jgi:hypothetical protein
MSPSGRLNWLTFNTKAACFASESFPAPSRSTFVVHAEDVPAHFVRLREAEGICVRRCSNSQPSAKTPRMKNGARWSFLRGRVADCNKGVCYVMLRFCGFSRTLSWSKWALPGCRAINALSLNDPPSYLKAILTRREKYGKS